MDLALDTDVLAARGGDRDAFARLVSRYRGLVSAISLSTVRDVGTSEDVAQEVFLSVWRDLGGLRNPASFVPWLRSLARHRALDVARGGNRRGRSKLTGDAALEAAVDPRPTAQDALLEGESARAVALGLDALPAAAREVVILFYREEQSIEQVARLLGLNETAVKKRLSRARATLREDLLVRFADAVETTAPNGEFSQRVMRSLPPFVPGGIAAAGKLALPLVTKSAAFALGWAWLAGIVGGIGSVLWGLRRDLRLSIDARERKRLWLIAALVIAGVLLFELGVMSLPARTPATVSRRLWLGTAYTLAYSALIFAAYFFGHRPLRARRRQAELVADPCTAARHAREDRRGRLFGWLASAAILAVLIAAWIRR